MQNPSNKRNQEISSLFLMEIWREMYLLFMTLIVREINNVSLDELSDLVQITCVIFHVGFSDMFREMCCCC